MTVPSKNQLTIHLPNFVVPARDQKWDDLAWHQIVEALRPDIRGQQLPIPANARSNDVETILVPKLSHWRRGLESMPANDNVSGI